VAVALTRLRDAEEYTALCDVVGVTRCTFNLGTEREEQGRDRVPMLSRWRMQEQHSGERGLPRVQHAFFDVPWYEAGDAPHGAALHVPVGRVPGAPFTTLRDAFLRRG
jgi:hypothetical protein